MNMGGPLAWISKAFGKVSEIEVAEKIDSEDKVFLVNSEDEAMAYYLNNKVNKFFNKPYPKFKGNNGFKGSLSAGKGMR